MLIMTDFSTMNTFILMFYPATAIFSVPLFASSIMISLRALAISDQKKAFNESIIAISVILALVFFPAVVTYSWMGFNSPYATFYHIFGYFISIVIVLMAMTNSINYKLNGYTRTTGGLPLLVCVLYIMFISIFTSGNNESVPVLSYTFGAGYASIQFILPLIYFIYLRKSKKIELLRKNHNAGQMPVTKTGKINPNRAVVQNTIELQSRSNISANSNVTQNINNWQ